MLWRQSLSIVFVAASVWSIADAASAQTSDDRVLAKLAALEARVTTLEKENREYKREVQQSRALAREKISGPIRESNAAIPAGAVPAPPYRGAQSSPTVQDWTGAYWGVSAGGAATRSRVSSFETESESLVGNPPANNTFGQDILGNSGPGNAGGVLLDAFAGWNLQFSNVIVGGQLEATAANLDFSSVGSKTLLNFNANGLTGQTSTADFRPQVASRWMASALLRAGVLLNEKTLIYGIGGWTLAQFESRNVTDNPFYQPVETFMANGWTAGAGIERKLDSSWSIRAEYRYTDFGRTIATDHFNFQFNGPTTIGSETNQRQIQYSETMQAGRIGIAYALSPSR